MAEEEDIISLLPDCLLLEIISRLPTTKHAIKTTSTLSKRWQRLWTLLPTLVFIGQDDILEQRIYHDPTDYYSFIDKTLTHCPTNVNLKKFKFQIKNYKKAALHTSQVKSWIHYAITRNVQEVEIRIWKHTCDEFSYDDELFFNNSCITSMKLSHQLHSCVFNPPNGAIRWDKLKCLCIDDGTLSEHFIGISRSPCLETLELNYCLLARRFVKSLFGNFGIERLSCDLETYERFGYDLFDEDEDEYEYLMSIKFSRCEFNPPNGAIRWDKLTFLCIDNGKLVDDSIGKILSRSPCLETLELKCCCGFRRIDVTSKSVKNLVLNSYGDRVPKAESYINTLEINAPYILSLKIKGKMYLEKFLLENVSSLVKADLSYAGSNHFSEVITHFSKDIRRHRDDIEEELLRGLLLGLGHVNEITLADNHAVGEFTCLLEALSRLEATGFQFRKGSDLRGSYPNNYIVFSLIDVAAADEDRIPELFASAAAESKTEEKVEETGESDDDDMRFSLFD